jgi:hypothetical protein
MVGTAADTGRALTWIELMLSAVALVADTTIVIERAVDQTRVRVAQAWHVCGDDTANNGSISFGVHRCTPISLLSGAWARANSVQASIITKLRGCRETAPLFPADPHTASLTE